jgi:hypothetical protein
MPELISRKMAQAIRAVEGALVRGDFRKVGSECRPSRLSAVAIGTALRQYGGQVIRAPSPVLKRQLAVRIRDSQLPRWAVDYDLWIDGKASDLTLSLTLVTAENGKLSALVDDLHVL